MNINIISVLFSLLFIYSCSQEKPVNQSSEIVTNESLNNIETDQMKQELLAIAEDRSNIRIWHLNKERALQLDNTWPNIQDPGQRITLLFKSGMEWLNAGDYEKSIARLNEIFSFIKSNNVQLAKKDFNQIRELLGISYLRKAEVENCIRHHTPFSCVFPILPDGQHIEKDGASNALNIFKELILSDSENYQYKWLYNICHMTLGTYPGSVEKDYLIDPAKLESDIEFPRFFDIAGDLGVGINDISGSVIIDDFNNDHYYDIIVSSYGLDDQLYYFENDGIGNLIDKTKDSNLSGILSGLNMIQADYNNDGLLDFLVLRGAWLAEFGKHPNSLLKNNGNGTFSDVTRSSGLYSLLPTQTATWQDFNNDGWIDLFIANESSPGFKARCQLFFNNQDGTFKEVSQQKDINVSAFIKGCTSADYNNDGYADIYLSLITGKNILLKNLGKDNDFRFVNVAQQASVEGPIKSFPCWFFDVNQDGLQDLFVSGFDFTQFETAAGEVCRDMLGMDVSAEKPALYINNADGTFSEESVKYNVSDVLFTMGCNFGDLNNDGLPDFYAATGTPDFRALIPNKMYLNDISGFKDITTVGGFGHLQKGHGVAFADIDMDGDQDIYNVLGGSYDGDNFMNTLYENPGTGDNQWLKLKLIGNKVNKSAIGAVVATTVLTREGREETFYNTVNSGASFGANPLTIEQGLGQIKKILYVTVTWPGNKSKSTYSDIMHGQYYILEEGVDKARPVSLIPVNWKKRDHHHHH